MVEMAEAEAFPEMEAGDINITEEAWAVAPVGTTTTDTWATRTDAAEDLGEEEETIEEEVVVMVDMVVDIMEEAVAVLRCQASMDLYFLSILF